MTPEIGSGLAPTIASTPAFSATTAWIILALAGLTEIGWAVGLKYSDGFSRLWPSVFTISLMIVSMVLLAQAARVLPIGTAYAVWTGIGAVGAGVLGMVLFKEPHTAARIACIALIIAGIVGLKLTSSASGPASEPSRSIGE